MTLPFLSEININKETGASLIFAVLLTTLFTSMIYIIATRVWTNARMDALTISEQRSFYLAESGIEFALKQSATTANYNWQDSLSYENGQIILAVSTVNGDTVQYVSTGRYGIAGKRNSLTIYTKVLTDYAVYITGPINGTLYGDINSFRSNQPDVIEMDLDTLRTIAQSQGTYYTQANKTINWQSSCTFLSNPADSLSPPNVIFAEQNLTIQGTSGTLCGIIVSAGGWIKFKTDGVVNGIVYIGDDQNRNLNGTGTVSNVTINGGVVGSIQFLAQAQFTANVNSSYLSTFYNFASDPSQVVQITRLNWENIF